MDRARRGPSSAICCLCTAAFAVLSCSAELSAGPAFLWSTSAVAGSSQQSSQTAYQETSLDYIASLAGNLTQASESSLLAGADLVTIFSGPQVSLRRVAAAQASSAEALLRSQVQSSSAALSFPFAVSKGSSWEQGVRPAQGGLWVGGACRGLASQPLASLPAALASGDARTLLLCVEDCAASGCMQQALSVVQQHAAAEGLSQAFAYLPQSPGLEASNLLQGASGGAQDAGATQRRRLQQTTATSTVLCNAKCQSQVKLYEAFILAVLLLSSLFTGLICMHVLGVPDKFEKPRDTGSRQD